MKTLQELYEEVRENEELKKEFSVALRDNKVKEFASKHGCKATRDEVNKFIMSFSDEERELAVEELEQVAGGLILRDVDQPQSASEYISEILGKYGIN